MNTRTLAVAACLGFLCPPANSQEASEWHPAPVPTLVLLEDGRQVELRDPDGQPMWRFRADRGSFTRESGHSVACNGRTVFIATDESFYAIAMRDGRLRWRYRFAKKPQRFLSFEATLAGRLFVKLYDAGSPLLCFDAQRGTLLWRYPKRNLYRSYDGLRVHEGLLLANVESADRQGTWVGVKTAIDLHTGTAKKWRPEFDQARETHDDWKPLAFAYAGEDRAPSKDGDMFVGTIVEVGDGYGLLRPRFYEFLPSCTFGRPAGFPEQLVGKRARVFARVFWATSSYPSSLGIQPFGVEAVPASPTDPDGRELVIGDREVSLFRAGNKLWAFSPDRGRFFRGSWNRSRALSNGDTIFVSTETDLYALSASDGRRKWGVAIAGPEPTRIGLLRLWGKQLIAALDSRKPRILCVDVDTGQVVWTSPVKDTREPIRHFDPTMHEGTLYVRTRTLSGRPGALVIDRKTGQASQTKPVRWSIPPKLDDRVPLAVRFDDRDTPRREGNDYIGVLTHEGGHYSLESTRLFRHDRRYSFVDNGRVELGRFVGKHVRIRGNVTGTRRYSDLFDTRATMFVEPLAVRLEPRR